MYKEPLKEDLPVYQSEQFHTSNYRGNQPGHDNYLRSDSQTPSSFGVNQNVTSQYKGLQKNFQPTGMVNSVYGQQQNQTPASFHTASYRGDQPGHDAYLRSDSTQPSQGGYGAVNTSVNYGFTSNTGYGAASGYGQNQNQTQYASPDSYHTANYRGNQPGHDAYLRSDSFQPTQGQFNNTAAYGQNTIPQQYNTQTNQNYASGNYGMNTSNTQQNYGQQQYVSPNSFHTANYRGDQPGHDAYLRSDSNQTAQSQFGSTGMSSGYNNNFNKF